MRCDEAIQSHRPRPFSGYHPAGKLSRTGAGYDAIRISGTRLTDFRRTLAAEASFGVAVLN
jgi:hypothetical protein